MDESARNRFFNEHMAWANRLAALAHRRGKHMASLEEIEAAAQEGLWDAVLRWDNKRPFRIYAQFRIKGAIYDYLRSLLPRGVSRGAHEKTQVFSCLDGESMNRLADDRLAPPSRRIELSDEIDRLLSPLDAKRQTIIRSRFLLGLSPKEIAAQCGINANHYAYLLNTAIKCLRERWLEPRARAAMEEAN